MDGTRDAALSRLADLGERARDYLAAGHAANTRRAYATDWRAFSAWCADHGLVPLPASSATLTLYLTAQADALRTSSVTPASHPVVGH